MMICYVDKKVMICNELRGTQSIDFYWSWDITYYFLVVRGQKILILVVQGQKILVFNGPGTENIDV